MTKLYQTVYAKKIKILIQKYNALNFKSEFLNIFKNSLCYLQKIKYLCMNRCICYGRLCATIRGLCVNPDVQNPVDKVSE